MIFRNFKKALACLRWLPAYAAQRVIRRPAEGEHIHLLIAVADHFEPAYLPGAPGPAVGVDEQRRRLDRWCTQYPKMAGRWRDAEDRPFRHTYFYPAEQYDGGLIDRLANHCSDGWGEVEVHLHHGVERPDSADNLRRTLVEFRDTLVSHGCLSRWNGAGPPRYAFVHGNWALANSARNSFCGVDGEMQILAETGCYADLTLPSAPYRGQVSKINAIYECALPLTERAPHRRGLDLHKGRSPHTFPLIVQGPLGLRSKEFSIPRIENGEITTANPPALDRLRSWVRIPIVVRGRQDWVFLKLHCHGMDPRDEEAMFGGLMDGFLRDLTDFVRGDRRYRLHYVTAREMVNVMLAACDNLEGDPGEYRDYRLKTISPSRFP